jgi:hypothetical protein
MELLQKWRNGRPLLWMALAGQMICLLWCLGLTGLYIDVLSIALLGLPILVSALIAIAYRNRVDAARLLIAAEATTILMAILAQGELITYAAGTSGFPYADRSLRSFGLAVGFDWLAYAQWFNQHPLLCQVLRFAYDSFGAQFVLVLAVLAMAGHVHRLQVFVLACFLSLSVTCLIFTFAPAISAYGYFGTAAQQLTNIYPADPDNHVTTLLRHIAFLDQLRNGTMRLVDAQTLVGLITFPSFHACAAALFIWAFWGVRLLRAPAAIVNMGLLAGSPLFGGHYLVDLIAGLLLTSLCIVASHHLMNFWPTIATRARFAPWRAARAG